MSNANPVASELRWRKASRSAGNGACVEVAPAQGYVAIRDSKNPQGAILSCAPNMFRSFLEAAKKGHLRP
jgi:hypothetical protein